MEMSPRVPDTHSQLHYSDAVSPQSSLKFISTNGQYQVLLDHDHQHRHQLKNSLLAAVGFFELANAGDFAANVWNKTPLPKYAIALMAIGGTFALCMTYFAYRDARLSWQNLQGLRCERRYLLRCLKEQEVCQDARALHALLDVNRREMGTEIIDRFGMDIFMGFGAVMVGLGTLIAIDSANQSVFLASNLLSGYIGNAPLAAYGLVNFMWSVYVWLRARRHHSNYYGANATKRVTISDTGSTVGKLLKARTDAVQIHAALNGITGIVAGAASLVTSTMWWGYVVLCPCIVISIIVNYAWRHGLGYDRPLVVERLPNFDEAFLVEELQYTASIGRMIWPPKKSSPRLSLSEIVSGPESFPRILEFLAKNELLEGFCLCLLNDSELSSTLFDLPEMTTITIQPYSLSRINDVSVRSRLIEIARDYIAEVGFDHFKYRERYLLETLGCYLTTSTEDLSPKDEEMA